MDPSPLRPLAEEVRARNRLLATIPGSGHHPSDVDWRGRPRAPQLNGLPAAADHVLHFHDDERHVFIDRDADRVLDALREYHRQLAAHVNDNAAADLTGTQRNLYKLIPRLKVRDGVLELPAGRWNDYLEAIYQMGIGLTGVDLP